MSEHAADRLVAAIEAKGTPACVGLDPVIERIGADVRTRAGSEARACGLFCMDVIDAVSGSVPAVKVQAACFERYGSAGVAAMERVVERARDRRLFVILDAKRGDIALSAEHYAIAAEQLGIGAVTVNAYMGPSVLGPFLDAGLGVFALVRTSNDDAGRVQSAKLADGRTVAEMMADLVAQRGQDCVGERGYSDAGAVVAPVESAEDGAQLRTRMPQQIFLCPGYGAQGASAEQIRPLLDTRGGGVLVTASRSIIYAKEGAGEAVKRFADDVRPLWRAQPRSAVEKASSKS